MNNGGSISGAPPWGLPEDSVTACCGPCCLIIKLQGWPSTGRQRSSTTATQPPPWGCEGR